MEPPPASKNEATARALLMVRKLGFFSADLSDVEAAAMMGMTLMGLCGGSITDDVMDFMYGHLVAARQAAIQRGYVGASKTAQ